MCNFYQENSSFISKWELSTGRIKHQTLDLTVVALYKKNGSVADAENFGFYFSILKKGIKLHSLFGKETQFFH